MGEGDGGENESGMYIIGYRKFTCLTSRYYLCFFCLTINL